MNRNRLLIIGFLFFMLTGCRTTDKPKDKTFDKGAETLTINFSKYIFSQDIINSKEILDTLKNLSDTIYADTAKYFRTPKATIYANNAARTFFQVFENPTGIITAITFFKNKKEINVAEYFKNGQVICRFNVTDEGVRNGNYFCFYENGKSRIIGYFKNGTEIRDSSRTFIDK